MSVVSSSGTTVCPEPARGSPSMYTEPILFAIVRTTWYFLFTSHDPVGVTGVDPYIGCHWCFSSYESPRSFSPPEESRLAPSRGVAFLGTSWIVTDATSVNS
ncbi:exo-alpha-sialidase [Trypanosoma cruzi]|nr:exo-alpha-sialidase [Trypanosoma cruzi]